MNSIKLELKKALFWAIITTVLIESACVIFRFGLGLTSTEQTRSTIGLITCGIRIHHGYIGVLMFVLWPFFIRKSKEFVNSIWFVSAFSLTISDLAHHFLVLWPLVGHHHFDLVY